MIRKINKNDDKKLMEYLKKQKEINLFIIGDVENFGYDNPDVMLWGDFNDKDELSAVLCRFFSGFVFYNTGNYDSKGFAKIMESSENFEVLSGSTESVTKFEEILNFKRKRDFNFASLNEINSNFNVKKEKIYKADLSDVDGIFNLRKSITEFSTSEGDLINLRTSLLNHSGRIYFTKSGDKYTSCASTTAENKESAMIVGVCTDADYRGQGLASSCVFSLCNEVLSEGKSLCLFYNNPKAAGIYKRLGFKDIGKWTMFIR